MKRVAVRACLVAAVVAIPLVFLARSHHVGTYAEMPHGVTHQVQIWRDGSATYLRDVYVGPELRTVDAGPPTLPEVETYAYRIDGRRLAILRSDGLSIETFDSSAAAWQALERRTFYRPNIELALSSGAETSKPSWTKGL